ncbi:TonB-dependent receptor plug domain-containing protein [Aquisalinus flavus]|uniref:TonB-dependent receptor n=1 Tax=Aquisalinus flavus TaxID=1526572 RepID=A0A8J2V4X1_9PROT|nr:TonB-dependent receptor [Aquisalinus flavus]MBD0427522.1 TonB-dependent receptor [Aquisalinus flavus]UNE47317.1 TonB-dependent receptor [Aquisalinus flavus]GGD01643.1 TonB-dependent receptor [Aquisalinus flavus]
MNFSDTKKSLLATSILAGLSAMMLAPAAAQDDEDSSQQAEDAQSDVIVVTGSRIRRPDYDFSNPVTSIDEGTIERSGATNMTDFVQEVPALVSSIDSEDYANTADQAGVGLNLLDLRNLGTNRTLVLVDGRRHVGSEPGTAAVDINTIPVGLIERIEVLTGGASAVYGADGVTGVVNFILKDNYEGFSARAQTGTSQQGGGDNTFISMVGGKNFMDGRLNITGALEMSQTNSVDQSDRRYSQFGRREILISNPDEPSTFGGANDPDILDNIFATGVTYIDTSPVGGVYTDPDFGDSLAGNDFTGNGDPWQDGVSAGGFLAVGGDGSLLDGFVDQLLPELDRYTAYGSFDYELTPSMNLFGDLKYVNTTTQFIAQPTFDYFLEVPFDNPFIPDPILADAMPTGGPFGADTVYVARDNFDLGNTGRDIERETWRSVIGLDGAFWDNWFYEASYTYGQTKETSEYFNDRQADRFAAAIDAVRDPSTGEIVCRSDLDPTAIPSGNLDDDSLWGTTFTPGANSGCVPADIFGADISAEAAAWINTTTVSDATIEQQVWNAFVTGDSSRWFELPAGPVGVVFGVEYREESAANNAAPIEEESAALGYDITWSGQGTDTVGEFDVFEYFAEVDIPLVRDVRFIQELRLDAAYRGSDYSTTGRSETWKVGGIWQVNDFIRFRGTTAQAVRAPNINELFLPQSQTFSLLADPCTVVNLDEPEDPEVEALRLQNCTADLGFDPEATGFNPNVSSAIEGRVGGNPDLDVETAMTDTYGFVLQPSFIENLTISLDYYDIELEDAIQFFDAQTIVDKCYDLPRPNQFCPLVTRDTAGDGRLSGFQQFAVNVASYTTSGYDLSVRYSLDPQEVGLTERNIGQFDFGLIGNKLNDLTFVELEDAPTDQQVGDAGAPEYQATFDLLWTSPDDVVQLNYGYSWFDETQRFEPGNIEDNPDIVDSEYYNWSARSVHDVQARFNLSDQFSVYGGVNNLLDQEPDRGSLNYPVNPLGRFYYLGVQINTN